MRHIRNYTTAQKILGWQATKYDADEEDTTGAAAEIEINMIITMMEERLRELVDQGKWQ